jgi:hypothetical protein
MQHMGSDRLGRYLGSHHDPESLTHGYHYELVFLSFYIARKNFTRYLWIFLICTDILTKDMTRIGTG